MSLCIVSFHEDNQDDFAKGRHSLKLQKAHATHELSIVAKMGNLRSFNNSHTIITDENSLSVVILFSRDSPYNK